MPLSLRRHPSVDLRKAARLAELATKNEIESFSLGEDMESIYKSKIYHQQQPLRLTTSSPILSNQYQSDEEQPSPQVEEFDEPSLSEYASCESSADEAEDVDFDGDDEEVDFEIEDVGTTLFVSALAIAMPMRSFKPSLIDISILAPMAQRSIPISRPQSASYTTLTRVKAPSPREVRISIYGSSPERPVRNFSTPLPRAHSLSPPESLHSGTSPASSCLSLSNTSIDEVQATPSILAGTEWEDNILESPTPTSWAAYDPFALSAPTLAKTQSAHQDMYEKPRGWKRLGLRSKLLAAGRATRRS